MVRGILDVTGVTVPARIMEPQHAVALEVEGFASILNFDGIDGLKIERCPWDSDFPGTDRSAIRILSVQICDYDLVRSVVDPTRVYRPASRERTNGADQ
jgi:hypothetical protein